MANRNARRLRANLTDAERFVWSRRRGRQMAGVRFRRQEPIGPYIVDFLSYEVRLVIELDGGQHAEQAAEDQARTRWPEGQGFRVVRFWNHEALVDWDVVGQMLWELVTARKAELGPRSQWPPPGAVPPTLTLPREGGGDPRPPTPLVPSPLAGEG